MYNIATTKEQSRRLLALGVKASIADMVICSKAISYRNNWNGFNEKTLNIPYKEAKELTSSDEVIPAFSLSCLLGILPKGAKTLSTSKDDDWWSVTLENELHEDNRIGYAESLISACVGAIEYLLFNGYELIELSKDIWNLQKQ